MTKDEIHKEMLAMARAIASGPVSRSVNDIVDMSQYIVEKILDIETTSDIKGVVREEMQSYCIDHNDDCNLDVCEKRNIMQALAKNRYNRRAAALDLGISERTLYRKIKDYGLDN